MLNRYQKGTLHILCMLCISAQRKKNLRTRNPRVVELGLENHATQHLGAAEDLAPAAAPRRLLNNWFLGSFPGRRAR